MKRRAIALWRRMRLAMLERRIASVQLDCVITEAEIHDAPRRLEIYRGVLRELLQQRQRLMQG